MTVLVTTATRHGATQEIAEAIGVQLRARGLEVRVDVLSEDGTRDAHPEDYEAVVLGSAVYVGRWQPAARRFAREHSAALRERPVWLFSSGPVGGAGEGADGAGTDALVAETGARGHRSFGGKLDRSGLRRLEGAVVSLVHAEDGDERNWVEIRAWSDDIAESLRPRAAKDEPRTA